MSIASTYPFFSVERIRTLGSTYSITLNASGYDTPTLVQGTSGQGMYGGYAPDVRITVKNQTLLAEASADKYVWDFGDYYNDKDNLVTQTTETTAEHRYVLPGTYPITLEVHTANGVEKITQESFVHVAELAPSAVFVGSVAPINSTTFNQVTLSGTSPLTVYFTASGTKTGSFPITQIDWDFGDGSPIYTVTRYPSDTSASSFVAYSNDVSDPRNFVVAHEYNRTTAYSPSAFTVSMSAYAANTFTCTTTTKRDIVKVSLPAAPDRKLIGSRLHGKENQLVLIYENQEDKSTSVSVLSSVNEDYLAAVSDQAVTVPVISYPSTQVVNPATLPEAPGAVTVLKRSYNSIALKLPPLPANADVFKIRRSIDGSTFNTFKRNLPGGSVVIDSSRVGNTVYYYRAIAMNSKGDTPGPITQTSTTSVEYFIPAEPVAPTFQSVSSTNLKVNLGTLTDYATSMSIQRSSDNVTFLTLSSHLSAGGDIIVHDTGLSVGTEYYYRTAALNDYGVSFGESNMVETSIPYPRIPTQPTLVSVTTTTATLNLSTFSQYATAQRVEYTVPGGTIWFISLPQSANQPEDITVTGLTAATQYVFRTAAINSTGATYSTELTASSLIVPPVSSAPPTVEVMDPTTIKAVLPTPPTDADGVRLYVSDDGTTYTQYTTADSFADTKWHWSVTTTPSGTLYDVIEPDSIRYYKAEVYNIAGSTMSTAVTAQTPQTTYAHYVTGGNMFSRTSHYFHLGEVTGATPTFSDHLNNSYGTLNGPYSAQAGISNGADLTAEADNKCIQILPEKYLKITLPQWPFTIYNGAIDFWTKTSTTGDTWQVVYNMGVSYQHHVVYYNPYRKKFKFRIWGRDTSTGKYGYTETTSDIIHLADNLWHHVRVQYDIGTTRTGDNCAFNLYIDGKLAYNFNLDWYIGNGTVPSGSLLMYFGDPTTVSGGASYTGYIDSVAFLKTTGSGYTPDPMIQAALAKKNYVLENLELWLKADSMIHIPDGTAATNWYNSSPTLAFSASTVRAGERSPILQRNVINSYPALQYSNTDARGHSISVRSIDTSPFAGDFTIMVVAQPRSTDATIDTHDTTSWELGRGILSSYIVGYASGSIGIAASNRSSTDPKYAIHTGIRGVASGTAISRSISTGTTIDENETMLITMTRRRTTGEIWVYLNGTLVGTQSTTITASLLAKTFYIGKITGENTSGIAEGYFNGYVAEVMGYSRILTAEELVYQTNYLKTKYNIL